MPELSTDLIQLASARIAKVGLWREVALNLEGVPHHLGLRWLKIGSEKAQEGVSQDESLEVRLVLAFEFAESQVLERWVRNIEMCFNTKSDGQWQRYAALIDKRFPEYAGAAAKFGTGKVKPVSLEAELAAINDADAGKDG